MTTLPAPAVARQSLPVPAHLPPTRSLLPLELPLLMGAGPTPIVPEVARAGGLLVNHLGPTMRAVLGSIQEMARYVFQTRSPYVLGFAGPGSAGLEMAAANLVGEGDRVLSLIQGTFSSRFSEMASACGAEVVELRAEPGGAVPLGQVAAALAAGPFALVSTVQGETSAGSCNPWIDELAQLCREHGALLLVDAVCTLSTMPLPMDAWGIDVVVTGGQKGLSSVPGVSLIALSESAWARVLERPRPIPHWVFDLQRAWGFWGENRYHYTAPVPGLLALHAALRLICQEGLEARYARHTRSSSALQAALGAMGLTLFAPPETRLQSVLAINTPPGVDADALRAHMEDVHKVQIAGAFGLDIFRIGQMGEQCRPEALRRTVEALADALGRQGHPVELDVAVEALVAGMG